MCIISCYYCFIKENENRIYDRTEKKKPLQNMIAAEKHNKVLMENFHIQQHMAVTVLWWQKPLIYICLCVHILSLVHVVNLDICEVKIVAQACIQKISQKKI